MNDDNILKVGSNEMELVDFRILKETNGKIYEGIYGVNVAKVREIIKLPNLTELPGAPDYIDGIFDLRGIVIPVVNLAKWMNIKPPEKSELQLRVIITEFNNILIGFAVHEARRIRRISWSDIESASFASSDQGAFDKTKITGVTKIENDEVLLVLDLESIVEELGFYQPSTDFTEDAIEKFKGTALILDDSATARRIVKEAMQKMGFSVVEAKDGVDGLEKLNELINIFGESLTQELRIIISDVEMPQMDGFHFASHVKKDDRTKNIPLVFNSSISDHFSDIRGADAGADAYLTKFDASTFYTEVAKAIHSHADKTMASIA
ncbi:MAG: chemotaxis protein [Epsilonproteobacteria bacterium]|nr:chemotaxis protein [Campylobacterota bacterium]